MSRRILSDIYYERNSNDGTAARTRPLSIQDIMLQRREKKVASEAKKTNNGTQENDKGTSTQLEQESEQKSRKDPMDMHVQGSRKEKNEDTTREGSKKENSGDVRRESPQKEDMGYTPKEVPMKENYKERTKGGAKMDDLKCTPKVQQEDLRHAPKNGSKKESHSAKDSAHLVGKGKCFHHSQELGTSMGDQADGSKDRSFIQIRERNCDGMRSEGLKETGKRWSHKTAVDDKIRYRSEKLRNERKRKRPDFDNEQSSDADQLMLKKQDSVVLKRRRSRSGDHYQPRKEETAMQAEPAATKAPSSAIQSSEKKSATWVESPVKANQSNFPITLQPTVGQMDDLKVGVKMDDLKCTPKVQEEGLRHAPKNSSKKESSSAKDIRHLLGKGKSFHHSQKFGTSMSDQADGSKDRSLVQIRERNCDAMRSEGLKETGKRWSHKTVDDDKIRYRSEKLRNERNRKGRDFDNKKGSEADQPMSRSRHGIGSSTDSDGSVTISDLETSFEFDGRLVGKRLKEANYDKSRRCKKRQKRRHKRRYTSDSSAD